MMLRQTRSAPAGRRDASLLQKFRGGRPIQDYLDHDEARWLAEFNSYGNGTAAPDMARIRAMRQLIQHQTFAVCEAGRYRARPGPGVGATPPEGVPPAQQPAGSPKAAERVVVEVTLDPTERRRTVLCLPASASSAASLARSAHGAGGMIVGLSVGDAVVVHGLRGNNEASNGQQGVVLEVDSREDRCVVKLTGQAEPLHAKIRTANLKLCPVETSGGAPMTSPAELITASSPPPAAATPIVEVKSTDCLEEARALLTTCGPDDRVAVLNMANAFTPGGGFRAGCGAQEENLHRRSDLHLFLEDERAWQPVNGKRRDFYPIPEGAALYSRDVRVFRGPEATGYPMLSEPFSIDVVSCAAMSHPAMSTATRLAPTAEDDLRIKIRSLLTACNAHGATHIVLSALGCGAFRNPPDHVAELFKEALLPSAVNGRAAPAGFCFKRCVFSIFDDHNAGRSHNPEGNFLPFHRCFSASSTPALPAAAPAADACDDAGARSCAGAAAGLDTPRSAEDHSDDRRETPSPAPAV